MGHFNRSEIENLAVCGENTRQERQAEEDKCGRLK